MGIDRPLRRTCRQFVDGSYAEGGRWKYIVHSEYSTSPAHFIRAFLLIQKDLIDLFEYIEPADNNLECYSYRTHSLLFRACVEAEANFKAILRENGYTENGYMRMSDYSKVNFTHRLSEYEVKLPRWSGSENVKVPFSEWDENNKISWYEAYHATKHNRHEEFEIANFKNMIDAVCGVLVLLSSQFWTEDFAPDDRYLALSGGPSDGMESAIGDYFRVGFPTDWPQEMRYGFDWAELRNEQDPFHEVDYSQVDSVEINGQ